MNFTKGRALPDLKYLFGLIDWKSFNFIKSSREVFNKQDVIELRDLAKKRVPKAVYDYVEGSAGTESAYQRSLEAFSNVEFVPKALQDVSKIESTTKILGKSCSLPIIFAPTGYTRMMHHSGEIAVANVAKEKNLIYVLSTMGTTSPTDLSKSVVNVRKWMQIYVMQNRKKTQELILAAKKAGFEALVITIDTPVAGIKLRDLKNGLAIPPRITLKTLFGILIKPKWWINLITTPRLEFASFKNWNKPLSELANQLFTPSLKYTDLKWIKSLWNGPIIVKGIQNKSDAIKVLNLGVSAIVVSNHGGRQLDKSTVPLEILQEIVNAVGKKIEVYIDGGVLNGQDVFAALALGAKAVMIGRAYLYGLMAGGQKGVQRVIEILERDLRNTMALTGTTDVHQIQKTLVRIRNKF